MDRDLSEAVTAFHDNPDSGTVVIDLALAACRRWQAGTLTTRVFINHLTAGLDRLERLEDEADAEMAVANGVDPDDPVLERCR